MTFRPAWRAQPRRQVAVEFDDGERAAAFAQRPGQRTQAGADLDQRLAGPRVDQIDDRVQHRQVAEEMLAEALARLMFQPHGGSRIST